jgi:hypothetical protein
MGSTRDSTEDTYPLPTSHHGKRKKSTARSVTEIGPLSSKGFVEDVELQSEDSGKGKRRMSTARSVTEVVPSSSKRAAEDVELQSKDSGKLPIEERLEFLTEHTFPHKLALQAS